ncbi:MAG: hypothetical protein N2444_08395, partial [Methylocystis sp.]|nr:hypothetical protein [Methylocystis sp.]
TQTVLQLTGALNDIQNKIAGLEADGNTNLHDGFMWGWRTISPNGPFAAGRPYGDPRNRKVLIFMTDGFNHWGAYPGTVGGSDYEALGYYSYNGAANARFPDGSRGDHVNYQTLLAPAGGSRANFHDVARDMQDELTREACANAKAAGVEIFTIGFSTPSNPIDHKGLDLLKKCATNEDHFYEARDADHLNFDFIQIGVSLGRLRLTQ